MHRESALHHLLNGQAGAIHGDALTLLQAAVRSADPHYPSPVRLPASPIRGNSLDASDRAYDSGKHSRRSKTNNVSEPSARRSTTVQRGADDSGNAGIPGNTRTPLPSSTDTFDIGASGDATTHVGISRAVCTSDTPRLSIARRSNTMR